MGANHSKDELIYQQVNYGNSEGIKSLWRQGAGLEWIDKEGRTPLILASMRPDLIHVAKVLIELGANVNAFRPGSHAGTPLHHAAKRGLESTASLLLSHGANPLVMNDDCETPLDLARTKGHSSVVRAIENRICLFAGWLREINGPTILEAFVPQWVSKKIWAVVLPCYSRNLANPRKFELAVYPDLQVSKPRTVIALWKAQIEEPKFNQPDPALIIVDSAKKSRFKYLSAHEGDKQQMQGFYGACRGIYHQRTGIVPVPPLSQQINTVMPPSPSPPPLATPPLLNQLQAPNAPCSEDVELAMAINASLQTALAECVAVPPRQRVHPSNGWGSSSENPAHNGWGSFNLPGINAGTSSWSDQRTSETVEAPSVQSIPSAPPIFGDSIYLGPFNYPSIDSIPVDLITPNAERSEPKERRDGGGDSALPSTCPICLDAAVEGACIPCGHMAGCMSCLREIKEKKGECPVCRAMIQQVVRLYAV